MQKAFKEWIDSIKQHRKGDTFSPHKPLTLLWALANTLRGEQFVEYNRNEKKLETFFKEVFGKTTIHYPLFRLSNDTSSKYPFWEISPKTIPVSSSGDITISDARNLNFKAGFSKDLYEYFKAHPSEVLSLIDYLLQENFPETLHEAILTLLNLPQGIEANSETTQIFSKKRDPEFRQKIMALYDNKCAFCDLKIYLNNSVLPLEAAHIKWKAYNGPCTPENGICLCPTHHYAFDKGLWSLTEDLNIVLSEGLLQNESTKKTLLDFSGKSIRPNILDRRFEPHRDFLLWHKQNILC